MSARIEDTYINTIHNMEDVWSVLAVFVCLLLRVLHDCRCVLPMLFDSVRGDEIRWKSGLWAVRYPEWITSLLKWNMMISEERILLWKNKMITMAVTPTMRWCPTFVPPINSLVLHLHSSGNFRALISSQNNNTLCGFYHFAALELQCTRTEKYDH